MNIIQKIKDTIAYLKELFSCPICDSEDIMLSLYYIESYVSNLKDVKDLYKQTNNPGSILIKWNLFKTSNMSLISDRAILSHIDFTTDIVFYPEPIENIFDDIPNRSLEIDEFTVTTDKDNQIEIRVYGQFRGILEIILNFSIECDGVKQQHTRASLQLENGNVNTRVN